MSLTTFCNSRSKKLSLTLKQKKFLSQKKECEIDMPIHTSMQFSDSHLNLTLFSQLTEHCEVFQYYCKLSCLATVWASWLRIHMSMRPGLKSLGRADKLLPDLAAYQDSNKMVNGDCKSREMPQFRDIMKFCIKKLCSLKGRNSVFQLPCSFLS